MILFQPTLDSHMSISLKNFKYYDSMSEETLCFEASVYFNGKRIGDVRNDGHGGEAHFRADWKTCSHALIEQAEAWAKAFVPMNNGEPEFLDDEKTIPYRFTSVADYCDYAASQEARKKDLEKQYARACRGGKVLFFVPSQAGQDAGLFSTQGPYTPAMRQRLETKYPGVVIFAALAKAEAVAAFDQALETIDRQRAQKQASGLEAAVNELMANPPPPSTTPRKRI